MVDNRGVAYMGAGKVEVQDIDFPTLDEAPDGYADFDSGVAKKFVIDPNGLIAA